MSRTKGSKNGISTTPGYTAIGNVAKVINGVYESQLRQNNSSSNYGDWVARMAESRRKAENNAKSGMAAAKANAIKYGHKPSFNLLNTPTAARQYMGWEKSMQEQQETATKAAAQKLKAAAAAQASKNHMVTKGYDGNPTSEIEKKAQLAIQAERDKRAAAIRAKKVTRYDAARGSRSTLQNVIRDIRADNGRELGRDIWEQTKHLAKTAGGNVKTSARAVKRLINKIRSR